MKKSYFLSLVLVIITLTASIGAIGYPKILTDFETKLNNALSAKGCDELKSLKWYKRGPNSIYMDAARLQRKKIKSSKERRIQSQKIKEMYKQAYLKAGIKYAKCGEWTHLWTKHYWLKSRYVPQNEYKKHNKTFNELEIELTANGINLQEETLKFMSTANLTVDINVDIVANICKFFAHKNWYQNGKEITAMIEKNPYYVMEYIYNAKYKPALSKVIPYLSSDNYQTRYKAVRALGEIGDKKVISKLKIIAENDPYYVKDSSGEKDFQIRTTAKASIQKIKLRE